MRPLLAPLPPGETHRLHEFVCGAAALTPRVVTSGAVDVRPLRDRLLLRRLRPQGPRWEVAPEESRFVCSGGAHGAAALRTRPVVLGATGPVDRAFVSLRVAADAFPAAGRVALAARVGDDADAVVVTLQPPVPGAPFRERTVDVTALLGRHRGSGRALGIEVTAEVDAPPDREGMLLRVRDLRLAVLVDARAAWGG